MILSNITVPLLGLVDTAVIGHLDHAYFLGGSTVGAMIITFVIWLCGFLRMSTSGLAAQAYGARNSQQGVLVLLRGLLVACAIGGILIIAQKLYLDFALSLAGGSADVQFYARQYADIRIWGLPAALSSLVIVGWLLGNHQAKSVMWVLIITNGVNLVLDLVFVVGFGWQVKGVALATLIAEYAGLLFGLWLIAQRFSDSLHKIKNSFSKYYYALIDVANLSSYFKLNRDILIRTLCLEICFVFITFQGARLGDNVVAANAILMNFLLLVSFGLDGIANAVEAMVGHAKGEKNKPALQSVVNIALFWTAIFATMYALAFALFGEQFISLISDIPAVVNIANQYLIWIIFLPVIACWCFLFDGVYIGLMQAKTMRNSMLLATFGTFFPIWFLLQGMGNHGLWAAFSGFMLLRGISLAWHYKTHRHAFITADHGGENHV